MSLSPAAACIVYLIRHGATDNNSARPPRLQGQRSDLGLSAEGHWQATRAAKLLAERPLAKVYSSPLKRAHETAAHIAQPHGLPVTIETGLVEVDVGDWEGQTWEDIARAHPEPHRLFLEDPSLHGYLGGENLSQVAARVAPALERLMQANQGRHIAVVGHNVVNRVFLAQLMGIPMAKARDIHQDNCGVNVIRYRRGQAQLRTLNAAFHLLA